MSVAGIDVGATLCKLALQREGIAVAHYPSSDLGGVRALVEAWGPSRIGVTGGGADRLGPEIGGVLLRHVSEFEAWGRGGAAVAALDSVTLPARHLLVSLGTGTSVLRVDGERVERVGGTALGGGTIIGLGRLLLGTDRFDEIVALASRGDRRTVDLLVSDVYRAGATSILRDLTAASFAKLDSTRPEDVAHALMGVVGENVALICGGLARGSGAETIVYCGSTLAENPPLESIVREITTLFGHEAVVLPRGAFCGAVGAATLVA
jgi:type II pantothenate kinase